MNLKHKLSKQEQRQSHGCEEGFDGCQIGRGYGRKGNEVREVRSTNRLLQNSHKDAKYSIGYGVAKEPIHMTHEYDQWLWGLPEGVVVGGGGQKGTIWDNCNSIINKK